MRVSRLGKNQIQLLFALESHRRWYAGQFGCGWNWGGQRQTERMLDVLVARGLVSKEPEPNFKMVYRITDDGAKYLASVRHERQAGRHA